MEQLYGSPYYHVHRADLHKMLYDLVLNCRTSPIDIKLASTVIDVGVHDNPARAGGAAWVKLQDGQILQADLIVAADGVKSLIREVAHLIFLSCLSHSQRIPCIQRIAPHTNATPTGDAAYRAIVPTSHLLADPELRSFVDHPEMTGWMAPGRHLMAYCIVRPHRYSSNKHVNFTSEILNSSARETRIQHGTLTSRRWLGRKLDSRRKLGQNEI